MWSWVHILQPSVEGKLLHGPNGLDAGDRLQVTLIAIDVEQGYVNIAGGSGSPAMGLR